MDDVDRQVRLLRFVGDLVHGHVADLPADLRDVTSEELNTAELLYFQGQEAEAPMQAEQVAKLRFLAQHAPGAATIREAVGQLTPAELEAFRAITADDL